MLFNLVVAKFEYLKLVRESRLSCLGLGKIVYNFAARERLLDILIVKVYYGVTICEGLTLDSVVEYHLFLSVLIDSLNLSILSHILLNDFLVRESLVVVLLGILKTKIFVFVRVSTSCRWHCFERLLCRLGPVEIDID